MMFRGFWGILRQKTAAGAADRVFLPFLLIIFLDFWLYPVLQNVAVTMGTAARAPGERLVV